jgi:hypothetical protein
MFQIGVLQKYLFYEKLLLYHYVFNSLLNPSIKKLHIKLQNINSTSTFYRSNTTTVTSSVYLAFIDH